MASIIDDYKVHSAFFTDNDKVTVKVELIDEEASTEDELVLIEYYLEGKDSDPDFKSLLKQVTIDDLHENTVNNFRADRERFEQTVLSIARDEGIIYDGDTVNSDIYEAIIDTIFGEFNEEEHKEKLFLMKLKIFELNDIKQSKNRPLKAKLRKATNFVDVMKYTCLLLSPED